MKSLLRYPKPKEMPTRFHLNPESPLYSGLLFAFCGGESHIGSMKWPDSGPRSAHGTMANMAADDWLYIPQLNRWALDFDGADDAVVIANAGSLLNGLLNISVSAWCYIDTFGWAYPKMFGNGFDGPLTALWYNSTMFGVRFNGGPQFTTGTNLPVYTWYHIAFTWNGETARIYINAVQQASMAYSTPLNNASGNCEIGNWNFIRPLPGRLSSLLVHKRALSQAEVSQLADPSNFDLRVGDVPFLVPSGRKWWPAVTVPVASKKAPWHLMIQGAI